MIFYLHIIENCDKKSIFVYFHDYLPHQEALPWFVSVFLVFVNWFVFFVFCHWFESLVFVNCWLCFIFPIEILFGELY